MLSTTYLLFEWISSRINWKKYTPGHIIINLLTTKGKEKSLKADRENNLKWQFEKQTKEKQDKRKANKTKANKSKQKKSKRKANKTKARQKKSNLNDNRFLFISHGGQKDMASYFSKAEGENLSTSNPIPAKNTL